jgi:hypothetical protein
MANDHRLMHARELLQLVQANAAIAVFRNLVAHEPKPRSDFCSRAIMRRASPSLMF